jgi:hypothetical protein
MGKAFTQENGENPRHHISKDCSCNQALAQACAVCSPKSGSMSAMEMFRHLRQPPSLASGGGSCNFLLADCPGISALRPEAEYGIDMQEAE